MRRLMLAALAATCFVSSTHAQSNAPGPLATPSGELQFVRTGGSFAGMLDQAVFDRFSANTLVHFDDDGKASHTVTRMLVQTDAGPVLYDFHRRPPLVVRTDKRMTVKRVFWQDDEVVMQSSLGWFRIKGGMLTKLQSSRSVYH